MPPSATPFNLSEPFWTKSYSDDILFLHFVLCYVNAALNTASCWDNMQPFVFIFKSNYIWNKTFQIALVMVYIFFGVDANKNLFSWCDMHNKQYSLYYPLPRINKVIEYYENLIIL